MSAPSIKQTGTGTPAGDDPRNPQGRQQRRALLALLLMGGAAGAAWQLTPRTRMSTLHGDFKLEQVVPKQFGDWRMDEVAVGGVVNPQQEALLKQLYSQILTRTYVNSRGERVMLSIAYGNDQRDGMQMHYPEVCYPAQGFQLRANQPATLAFADAQIPTRQLQTVLGNQRYEPVTYWTMVGEKAVRGGTDKKVAELSYGFRDLIPDGLLFRVSTIDRDAAHAFRVHQAFASQLLAEVDPLARKRLAGV